MKKLFLIFSLTFLLAGCGTSLEDRTRFCEDAYDRSYSNKETIYRVAFLTIVKDDAVWRENCMIITDAGAEWAF